MFGGLFGDGAGGVLGFTGEGEGLGSVEVNLGVDSGAFFGLGGFGEFFGHGRCFC